MNYMTICEGAVVVKHSHTREWMRGRPPVGRLNAENLVSGLQAEASGGKPAEERLGQAEAQNKALRSELAIREAEHTAIESTPRGKSGNLEVLRHGEL